MSRRKDHRRASGCADPVGFRGELKRTVCIETIAVQSHRPQACVVAAFDDEQMPGW